MPKTTKNVSKKINKIKKRTEVAKAKAKRAQAVAEKRRQMNKTYAPAIARAKEKRQAKHATVMAVEKGKQETALKSSTFAEKKLESEIKQKEIAAKFAGETNKAAAYAGGAATLGSAIVNENDDDTTKEYANEQAIAGTVFGSSSNSSISGLSSGVL